MEKELVLRGQGSLDAVKAVQSLDVTRQRLKFMTNKIGDGDIYIGINSREFSYSKMWDKEDKVYYASDIYTVFLSASGKVFTRSRNHQGFTYDTKKNDLKLWGKTKLSNIEDEVIIALLLREGAEWALESINKRSNVLRPMYMHKGLFQRILKGRITNAEELVRAYLKVDTRWRELKISHRAKTVLTLMRNNISMHDLIEFLSIVSNVEATLDMLLNGKKMGMKFVRDEHGSIMRDPDGDTVREWDFDWFVINEQTQYDIRKELTILGRKIKSTWSATRIMSEHTEMSRQVLDLEVESMQLEEHGYQTPCPVLPGMELIDNNIRLYSEGRTMSHCIYGYLDYAKMRKNFHFHCIFGDTPFSLSIEWSTYARAWEVQQMYGKYNSSCTPAQRSIVEKWLWEDAVQAWFTHERELVKSDEDINETTLW